MRPLPVNKACYCSAFFLSALTVGLLLGLVAIELYPALIISTIDPACSLTVYNSASSDKSLGIMLSFAAIGIPLVAGYTYFVYRTLAGKVELDVTSYE